MRNDIAKTLEEIRIRIQSAAQGRPVKIVAASKTVPPERIEEAYRAGLQTFGENRIQEAIPKIEALESIGLEWHFIGHLQTNKVRDAVRYFSCIQSVDSSKLLEKIENESGKQGKKIQLLLELNIGEEASKHGLRESGLAGVLDAAKNLEWCSVRGFMMIPPFREDPEQVRPFFRRLREMRDAHFQELPELSMGMSQDYEVAVQEGATIVRIGTALFGERVVKTGRP